MLLLPRDKGKPAEAIGAGVLSCGDMLRPRTTKVLALLLGQALVGLSSILSSLGDPGSTFCCGRCHGSGGSKSRSIRPWGRQALAEKLLPFFWMHSCPVASGEGGQPVLLVPFPGALEGAGHQEDPVEARTEAVALPSCTEPTADPGPERLYEAGY